VYVNDIYSEVSLILRSNIMLPITDTGS